MTWEYIGREFNVQDFRQDLAAQGVLEPAREGRLGTRERGYDAVRYPGLFGEIAGCGRDGRGLETFSELPGSAD
jgi:hypothetical protein